MVFYGLRPARGRSRRGLCAPSRGAPRRPARLLSCAYEFLDAVLGEESGGKATAVLRSDVQQGVNAVEEFAFHSPEGLDHDGLGERVDLVGAHRAWAVQAAPYQIR